MLDRFSLRVAAEQFVAPTNNIPAVPRTTPDTPHPTDHLVICSP